ncbi:MAG: hypothetical protein IPP32_02945 [Bacteroidetes bacterium]|nr:hypothetical protein [Bacteroidota bacterium]
MTSLIKINLSEKEIKIIKLISKEYTNREIATMLELSIRTVEYCRENIMVKTKSKSAIGIYKFALKNKMVKL